MDSWFIDLIVQYKYLILIPLAIIEGPVVSFVSGILVKNGQLILIWTYLALMTGDLIGDMIWYWLGYSKGEKFANKFGKYFSVTHEHLEEAKILFGKYHTFILLFSKITTGFGLATAVLFTAGISRVPFGRYMLLNTLGQIIWTGMLVGSGYFVGHLFAIFNTVFQRLGLAALIIIILVCMIGYGKYLKGKIKGKIK